MKKPSVNLQNNFYVWMREWVDSSNLMLELEMVDMKGLGSFTSGDIFRKDLPHSLRTYKDQMGLS